ncbi:MAG: MgtC/SapB family protein [Dehalococcoidia bacterium]
MSEIEVEILRFAWQDEAAMLVRLLVAALAGAIIGFERTYSGKRAGIRTVTMVSVGAAVFTLVSIYGFEVHDQSRVAAQVASGVGFLGAGAIIRQGGTVQGLTTAAAIWVAAALGLAAGVGLYIVAIAGALLATAAMGLLPHTVRVAGSEDAAGSDDSDSDDDLV